MLKSKARRLMVVLTSICNINCIMCERKSNYILPKKTVEQIVDFFPYLDSIMWQGGEVFLVDYFKEIFQEASRYPQLTQEINTNGLLITEEWAEIIARRDTRLIFSIDSTDKNIYEYIRKGARFQTLIRNITLLKQTRQRYGKLGSDIINVVVLRSNYQQLDSFIDFALKYGFCGINFLHMIGNVCPNENILNPPDKEAVGYLKRAIPDVIERGNSFGINVTYDFATMLSDTELSEGGNGITTIDEDKLFCLLPWKSLFVDGSQEGDVYPECICRKPVGNIFKESLQEIWNNRNMQLYRKRILDKDLKNWCNPNCIKGMVNKNFLQSL